MKWFHWAVLSILAAGNIAIHRSSPSDREFVSSVVQIALLDACPLVMVEKRFLPNPLLPEYLYLEGQSGGGLHSVYVGYYPAQGFGWAAPHDPSLCYGVGGWRVGETRNWLVPASDGGSAFKVRSIRVERDGERRDVTFWSQRAGRLPRREADAPWHIDLVDGLVRRRSDLAWIRWERPACSTISTADWLDLLRATMESVRRAMGE